MRTINLSVLQRYNRKQIREAASKTMRATQEGQTDQVDSNEIDSNRKPANQPYAG
ncbi:hypothetical protein [Endozoicomonas sp. ONNA2]|uniref:hypothetical protein n=1 Tax=Endozoicomonas sp. ONNA2 TaxID=2828741 RepID=UPI0021496F0E|nr:hypothetical protein [Endozoicomonas sp. ONNA2]